MKRRNFLKLSAIGGLALLGGGLLAGRAMAANRYYTGPVSDHFDGTRFFNPGGEEPKGFMGLLKWRFNGKSVDWPASYPSPFAPVVPEKRVSGNRLVVTMVGHASMLIQVAGLNILTDPVWSERTSPVSFVGPKRVNQPGIRLEDLPAIDIVIVTHNHYDHLDIETLKRIHAVHRPRFITPLGNDAIFGPELDDPRITVMDWGSKDYIGKNVTIHCEPCHHWSARGLNDRRMALWGAFVIETLAGKIYHIGDTGFHQGINYKAAAAKHGNFRLAILPIGAYEPRWFMQAQHQNPEEAVAGMQLAKASYAIGHHWGTVKLTDEGIEEPLAALSNALQAAQMKPERFRALRPGEVFDVPDA
ncbi:MBL fold metallo-hydrolase [Rhizobium helianthi]|uniref:MBL fold metallo-hydrolase n=1 Tax=Rhizobium helianthi TaxID=1132695 RepID=A0ABW4M5X1_9HYPH